MYPPIIVEVAFLNKCKYFAMFHLSRYEWFISVLLVVSVHFGDVKYWFIETQIIFAAYTIYKKNKHYSNNIVLLYCCGVHELTEHA